MIIIIRCLEINGIDKPDDISDQDQDTEEKEDLTCSSFKLCY
jgi:hypothetical protein